MWHNGEGSGIITGMALTILPVTTVAECETIAALSRAVWGDGDAAVPAHLLITIARNRGIVLLARDEENRPIAFCFSFPSRTAAGIPKQCSHQAGVLPAWQGKGVGEQLKRAQREAALAEGSALITWTFDPLQTRNARLNLHKLGAICRHYSRDHYGELHDAHNRGLASDRFEVAWWLTSERVVRRIRGERPEPVAAPLLNPPLPAADFPRPGEPEEAVWGSERLRVAVPRDFGEIKSADPSLAHAWRLHTRHLFETAFQRGYTATDLLCEPALPWCSTLLERDPTLERLPHAH
jgi:predicted GNAT superfamily acetyltransferase